MDNSSLAAGFSLGTREQWHRLAAAALARSGASVEPERVEARLGTPTDDGYALLPLYTRADHAAADSDIRTGLLGQRAAGWSIRQRSIGPPAAMAAAIAEDLAGDSRELWLTLLPGQADGTALADLLGEVDLREVAVALESFRGGGFAATELLDLLPPSGSHPSTNLGLDPFGQLAATGRPGDLDEALDLARAAAARGVRAFVIDGTIYHEAGASFGEEIGCATAVGAALLRLLIRSGLTGERAAELMEFRFAVTDDQFASIAKLRAARLVWRRVLDIAGIAPTVGQQQHAVTSWSMLTRRDPWVNLIRNTVAGFAGGVGGAQAVTVLPHSLATGEPDELSRRLARNTQHLLLAESHVGAVADPVAGSWYGEVRTDSVAAAAWEWLQELEGAGGIRAALENGLVAERLEDTWQRKRQRLARRLDPLTGVSEFPDPTRQSVRRGPVRPGGGLPQRRWAADFEDLRDRADALAEAGSAPVVPIVTVGPLSRSAARVSFIRNLLAAGGIGADEHAVGDGPNLPPEVVAVCVCGADDDVAEQWERVRAALPDRARVIVAGRPVGLTGVDRYWRAGDDAVAALDETLAVFEQSREDR